MPSDITLWPQLHLAGLLVHIQDSVFWRVDGFECKHTLPGLSVFVKVYTFFIVLSEFLTLSFPEI